MGLFGRLTRRRGDDDGKGGDGGRASRRGRGRARRDESSLADLMTAVSDPAAVAGLLRSDRCRRIRLDRSFRPEAWAVVLIAHADRVDWGDTGNSQLMQLMIQTDAAVSTCVTAEMLDRQVFVIIPDPDSLDAIYDIDAVHKEFDAGGFDAHWAIASVREQPDGGPVEGVDIEATGVPFDLNAGMDVNDNAMTIDDIINARSVAAASGGAGGEGGGAGMPAPLSQGAPSRTRPDGLPPVGGDDAQDRRAASADRLRASLDAQQTAPQAPAQQPPAQQTPVQQAPVQQPPAQQTPVQQPSVQQAPIQQAPVQQPPVQQPPAQQPPVQQAPVQQAPARQAAPQAPVREPSVRQPPAQQTDGGRRAAEQPSAMRRAMAARQAAEAPARQPERQEPDSRTVASDEDFDPAKARRAMAGRQESADALLRRTIEDRHVSVAYSIRDLDPLLGKIDDTLIPMEGLHLDEHTTWLREQTLSRIQTSNGRFHDMVARDKESIRRFYAQAMEVLAQRALDAVRTDRPSKLKDDQGAVVNADLLERQKLIDGQTEARRKGKADEAASRIEQLRSDFETQRSKAGEAARLVAENDFEARNRPVLDQRVQGMDGEVETAIITDRDAALAALTQERQSRADRTFQIMGSKLMTRLGDVRKRQAEAEQKYATALTNEIKAYLDSSNSMESVQKDILANDNRLAEERKAHAADIDRIQKESRKRIGELEARNASEREDFQRAQETMKASLQGSIESLRNHGQALQASLDAMTAERDRAKEEGRKAAAEADERISRNEKSVDEERRKLRREADRGGKASTRVLAFVAAGSLLLGLMGGVAGATAFTHAPSNNPTVVVRPDDGKDGD